MPFRSVSRVQSRDMGVLEESTCPKGKGRFRGFKPRMVSMVYFNCNRNVFGLCVKS